MKELAEKLQTLLSGIFPENHVFVNYSTSLGESITIRFAIEKKENWSFGYYENSTHITAMIFHSGIKADHFDFEKVSGELCKIIRNKKTVTADQMLKYIEKEFSKVKKSEFFKKTQKSL